MVNPLNPSKTDLRNFLIGGVVTGAAFAAYKGVTSPIEVVSMLFLGLSTLLIREVGQRLVGQWMEAEVNLEVSQKGATVTLLFALISYISVFNLAFLVPVFSTFSNKRYEHWGKSIDAIWAKRQYWLAASGLTTLLLGWTFFYSLGVSNLAELIALFTFFQLLPLDEEKNISGQLDGVYVLLWSGFMWAIFMGLTIIALILSTV